MVTNKWLFIYLILLFSNAQAGAVEESDQNFHVGIFHANGVDLVGYSVQRKIDGNMYWVYTFGFPSVAAIGINYYSNRDGNGWTANLGTGLAFHVHASIAYQVALKNRNYFKLGLGGSGTIDYGGSVLPIISYEHRF